MNINKLNFIGFIEGDTGYSTLSRALISLIKRTNVDIRVEDLKGRPIRQFIELQRKDPKNRFQLLHQIPTVKPDADGFYTVTEFDQPTYGSISILENAELILTESEFCKDVFDKYSDAEKHVINFPIDPQLKPTGPIYKFPEVIERYDFKFLSVFEWMSRKDPYTLVEAFVEEFDKDESVCLILRTWSKFESPRKWIAKLAQQHNVFIMPQNVPHMGPLYRACDAYVTSTLGEGFGHPIAEAMACGLKVIAPDSSGIREYANKKNALLIPTEEMTFKEAIGNHKNEIQHLIKPWFKCWKPDKEELKKLMRRAVRNDMKFIRDNAVRIKDKLSIDNCFKQTEEAFN